MGNISFFLRCAYLCTALVMLIGMSGAARADKIDAALVEALYQATRNIQEQKTDLDSLVWLSSMADKIKQRVPNPFYRIRLLNAVYAEAKLAGLDPQLVLAVIDIESNFNRYAKSGAGAEGLMQVMPFWKDVHGDASDDLYHPLTNLRYGCTILRYYLDKYPTIHDALAGYNGSLGRSKYPKKVLGKLARQWQFKEDIYSSKSNNELVSK